MYCGTRGEMFELVQGHLNVESRGVSSVAPGNMFARTLIMSQTHSIDIRFINFIIIIVVDVEVMECYWNSILICNDSSIHVTVLYPMDSEGSTDTGGVICYITHSSW